VQDVQAGIMEAPACERRFDLRTVSNKMDLGDAGDRLQSETAAINNDLASVVATHDIQRDSHKWKERG
jgi:hypothetical protein